MTAPRQFNHAYAFGFSVNTDKPDGSDLTATEARTAIVAMLHKLTDIELMENLGAPFDTYEEET